MKAGDSMIIPDMDFDVMWKDEKVAHICIKDEELVEAVGYTDNNFKRFLPMCPVTLPLVAHLLEARCWDRNRANIREILDKMRIEDYNPFLIVLQTHGVDYDDKIWFRFKGEEGMTWNDVDPHRRSA